MVTLILSDVIGDPLDIIASGPTVPDPSRPADCLEIVKKLNAGKKIPDAVIQYLQQAESAVALAKIFRAHATYSLFSFLFRS